MRKIFVLLLLVATSQYSQVDTTKKEPIQIGLDIMQSIPSYIFSSSYPIQNTLIIEPSLRHHVWDRKFHVFTIGYTNGRTDRNNHSNISNQSFNGVYFKMAFETKIRRIPSFAVGYGPIFSITSFQGHYKFDGPAFGDYYGTFKENSLALGLFGYMAFDITLSQKTSLRISGQLSNAITTNSRDPYYYPGLGLVENAKPFVSGANFGVQLFYKIR